MLIPYSYTKIHVHVWILTFWHITYKYYEAIDGLDAINIRSTDLAED